MRLKLFLEDTTKLSPLHLCAPLLGDKQDHEYGSGLLEYLKIFKCKTVDVQSVCKEGPGKTLENLYLGWKLKDFFLTNVTQRKEGRKLPATLTQFQEEKGDNREAKYLTLAILHQLSNLSLSTGKHIIPAMRLRTWQPWKWHKVLSWKYMYIPWRPHRKFNT